ncbi:uncharacterized protein LOC128870473 [Anastrepha ludens]|uniref:uncharacterized protein LOC128870473 n=1 Tax=Anastrepha ludens TaxID=28586 RepID=UPI0023AFF4A2|nr:uncharacterized protein LOC128870473 [Anastrepha ludens]
MHAKTALHAATSVEVMHAKQILVSNKNLTIVKKHKKLYTTSATTNLSNVDTELKNKIMALQTNTKNDHGCGGQHRTCLPTMNSIPEFGDGRNSSLMCKFTYRDHSNGTVSNIFKKNPDLVIESQKNKQLSFKNSKFLRCPLINYLKPNTINTAQSHIIDHASDFRHKTQFVPTDVAKYQTNTNNMGQFFLASGDSNCSLRKQLIVAVVGCDGNIQQRNSDNFEIGSADMSISSEVNTIGNRNSNEDPHVQNMTNNVLAEFVLKNNDSDNILMRSCTSELSKCNDNNVAIYCVPNNNHIREDLRKKTNSPQWQTPQDVNITGSYSQVGCLLTNSPNIRGIDNAGVMHDMLNDPIEQVFAGLNNDNRNCVDHKLMPKYVLKLHTKQSHAQYQQQRQYANADITADNLRNADYVSDCEDIQRLKCPSTLKGALTLQQEMVQQDDLQQNRSGKLLDDDNNTSGIPFCVSSISVSDCVEYLNDELEDLKVMLVC